MDQKRFKELMDTIKKSNSNRLKLEASKSSKLEQENIELKKLVKKFNTSESRLEHFNDLYKNKKLTPSQLQLQKELIKEEKREKYLEDYRRSQKIRDEKYESSIINLNKTQSYKDSRLSNKTDIFYKFMNEFIGDIMAKNNELDKLDLTGITQDEFKIMKEKLRITFDTILKRF